MILRDQCTFPLFEACATLRRSWVWRDFPSDKTFAFAPIAQKGIHVVVIVLRIRTILILCCRFVVAFVFVIPIRITDKWNLSFRLVSPGPRALLSRCRHRWRYFKIHSTLHRPQSTTTAAESSGTTENRLERSRWFGCRLVALRPTCGWHWINREC